MKRTRMMGSRSAQMVAASVAAILLLAAPSCKDKKNPNAPQPPPRVNVRERDTSLTRNLLSMVDFANTPDGAVLATICVYTDDNTSGPILFFYPRKGVDSPGLTVERKNKRGIVEGKNGKTEIPDGSVAFYDIDAGAVEVLAEKWDVKLATDHSAFERFVNELLAKRNKQEQPAP